MAAAAKNVLLIEDQPADAEIVTRFLEIAGGKSFRLTHFSTLRSAFDALATRSFDLILLDQRLPDSGSDDTLQLTRQKSGATPIVVMTGFGDDAEGARRVRDGAQDYLVKGAFDAAMLVRVMRYAIERSELLRSVEELRRREQVEREMRALMELAETPPTSGKSSHRALRDSAPVLFSDLTRRYGELLALAMGRRIYKQENSELAAKLRAFTTELAQIKSGPREIVDIHSAALERILATESDAKGQAHLEEGRLLLLETMGAMIRVYRSTSAAPEDPEKAGAK